MEAPSQADLQASLQKQTAELIGNGGETPVEQAAPEEPAEPQVDQQAAAAEKEKEHSRQEEARRAFALRRKARELEEKEQRLAAVEAKERAIAEREQKLAAMEGLDELAILEHEAKRRGITLEDLLRRGIARVANGGKPTPDMELQQAMELARKASDKAAALEEEMKRRDLEAEQRRAFEANEAMIDNYRSDAIESLDESSHPFLSTYSQDQVAEAALRAANEYAARTGQVPDAREVLDYLEEIERQSFEERAGRTGYTKAPPQPAPSVDEVMTSRGSDGKFKIKGARTVSNSTAAARGSAPIDYRKLNPRERARAAAKEVFGRNT